METDDLITSYMLQVCFLSLEQMGLLCIKYPARFVKLGLLVVRNKFIAALCCRHGQDSASALGKSSFLT